MPDPVATQLSAADDLISDLRKAAVGIKKLGDEVMLLRSRVSALEESVVRAEQSASDAEAMLSEMDHWRELLDDFKRGVRDRAELFEGTVGR